MKQDADQFTAELPTLETHLVISLTKKGFREFKTNPIQKWGSRWDSRIEQAHRFSLLDLPELLSFCQGVRTACVCLVQNDEITVLGFQGTFPASYGERKRSQYDSKH